MSRKKKRKALIYIMKDEFFYHLPSSEYVSVCKFGYEDFWFDKTILDEALGYSISKIPNESKRNVGVNYISFGILK